MKCTCHDFTIITEHRIMSTSKGINKVTYLSIDLRWNDRIETFKKLTYTFLGAGDIDKPNKLLLI